MAGTKSAFDNFHLKCFSKSVFLEVFLRELHIKYFSKNSLSDFLDFESIF